MIEEWRDVPGFEGFYQVSAFGRVRSLARCWISISGEICTKEVIMTLQRSTNGYMQIHLRRPGSHRKHYVHRLVANAFLTNPGDRPFVNHIDRDRLNNVAANLEWVTPGENTAHWMAHDKAELSTTNANEGIAF
jgi:hypothetical protein